MGLRINHLPPRFMFQFYFEAVFVSFTYIPTGGFSARIGFEVHPTHYLPSGFPDRLFSRNFRFFFFPTLAFGGLDVQ